MKFLTCQLCTILLWVKTWVKRFRGKSLDFSSNFSTTRKQEKVLKFYDFRTIYGCGGRTRTYDLRVMRVDNLVIYRINSFKNA